MSHVTAAPNVLAASAGELAAIGSTMRAANAAAAAPTAGVLAAGGDDVSAGIAALFGARAQAYQAISAQAALFHDRFVQILQEGAAAYAMAEAANALPLQKAQGVVSELAQGSHWGDGHRAISRCRRVWRCRPGWRKGLGRRTDRQRSGRRAAWGRPARQHRR